MAREKFVDENIAALVKELAFESHIESDWPIGVLIAIVWMANDG